MDVTRISRWYPCTIVCSIEVAGGGSSFSVLRISKIILKVIRKIYFPFVWGKDGKLHLSLVNDSRPISQS